MRTHYVEEPCRSALNRVTGMDFDWSLNPYTGCAHRCTYCYVRGFEKRADRPSDERYGRTIRVKINVAGVLRHELSRPSWKRDHVAVGAATDPYQPCEGRYRLTRACLEAFAHHRNPFSIITRGPMILRDLDVLQDASRAAAVDVNLSIPTLDERIWSTTEPGTSHPRARLRVLRELVRGGVRAGVGIAPVLPGLTDDPEKMRAIVVAARDAGATHLWCSTLYLTPGLREHFLENLARDWPEQLPRYERLYAHRAYLPKSHTDANKQTLTRLKREHPPGPALPLIQPEPEPEQIRLAL
jgi:DNA repair photolyase